ncbi:glycerophosphodiester phosphodiesterase [Levilactobacillus bambusae]|uniref:Glycerophosphodiester phosphodiesterase n=1 Tax=Levilactobacillus bambusae TaxID=2024736 RepID=A0A2V1N5B0_9LACO|nr:glycerophosphodiester phosphodiesterase [Levilactobacillus bambusae]PWG00996.1 glycerophosphodiester phosphodiesterase [Levilactobacillus bambusae]
MFNRQKTMVIAHRGSKGTRPENTLPAFQTAIDDGADGIETDVHLSMDGHLIVIHDEKVDRTTDGSGYVKDLTLAQIKALDAGSWYSKRYRGTRVPTLAEVVQLLIDNHFTGIFNLELKTNKIHYDGIEQLVGDFFKRTPVPFRLVFSSFNKKSVLTMHALMPNAQYAKLFSTNGRQAERMVRQHEADGLHPDIRWVREHRFFLPHMQMRPWTVNSNRDMTYCFKRHFAGIITDYPGRAVALRQQIQGDFHD